MSPGPPPPPRLLRDVREGYPRLSGSGGRERLRPHATRGWPGRWVVGLPGPPRAGNAVRHTRAPRSPARPTPRGGPRAAPCPPRHSPRRPLSHISHPLTPTPSAEPGPASPVTRRGRTESKMATPPPPPPHCRRGLGAPSRGAHAPEARLKIARPNYIWCGRIPARPRAPRPTPPRPASPAPPRPTPPLAALNGEGAGVTEGEPTPLSAARAGGGAGPTAEFSNIACVNHAPRVRQRRAAPGPAPPTSQALNGYNAAAPSFLLRLDWNPGQCKGSNLVRRVNFRSILPRSPRHHPVSSGSGEEIYPCHICNINFVFKFLVLARTFFDCETCVVDNGILPQRPPHTKIVTSQRNKMSHLIQADT